MFRDVYKSANNDILAKPEILDNILSNKHSKKYNNVYRYTSVAAACFILIGTLAIYPEINKNITSTEDKTKISISSFEETNNDFSNNTQPTQDSASEKTQEELPVFKKSTKVSNAKSSSIKQESKATQKPEIKSEEDLSEQATTVPREQSEQESSDIAVASVPIVSKAISEESEAISVMSDVTEEPAYDGTQQAEEFTSTSSDEALTEHSEPNSKVRMSGSGGSAKAVTCVTETEAVKIADTVFSQDFGEEFLKNTQIKTEFNENYLITRFNENESFSVTVFSDGSYEKLY